MSIMYTFTNRKNRNYKRLQGGPKIVNHYRIANKTLQPYAN